MTTSQAKPNRLRRWLLLFVVVIVVIGIGAVIRGGLAAVYAILSTPMGNVLATSVPPTNSPAPTAEPATRPVNTRAPSPIAATSTDTSSSPANANASATANSFDVTATQYALSATPVPANIALLVTQIFTVVDKSGNVIGNGQIRVYAPARMSPGEQNQVRVEIEALPISTPPNVTVFPQPTATPALSIGTPVPSLTPLPLVGINYLIVHEYMDIALQSVDPNRFTVSAIPVARTGIQRLYTGVVNRWNWAIVPSKEVSGPSTFAVSVELPRTRNDGVVVYDPAIDPIQFQVTVDPLPVPIDKTLENITLVAGTIAAIAGAIGAIYSGYRFLRRKSQTSSTDKKGD